MPSIRSSIYRRVWRVTHELPDSDQTVLFDPASSELLVLSDSGAAIWYLLDGERSEADIIEFIRAERPDAPPSLPDEVAAFLSDLLARRAIEIAGA